MRVLVDAHLPDSNERVMEKTITAYLKYLNIPVSTIWSQKLIATVFGRIETMPTQQG